MNWLKRLFCKDELKQLESEIESQDRLIKSLEIDRDRLEELELLVRCQKMYIEDDEAILELIEMSVKNDKVVMLSNNRQAAFNQGILEHQSKIRDISQYGGLQGLMGAGRVIY